MTCLADEKFDWKISTTDYAQIKGEKFPAVRRGAAVRLMTMNLIVSPSLNECELFLSESQSESTT